MSPPKLFIYTIYMSTKLPKYIVFHKKRGDTPLDLITVWKQQNPEYEHIPLSYAGRLDPMAEGRLLVLVGEECKRQRWYTKFDKEYEVEIVLDLGTDTLDVLGIPNYTTKNTVVTHEQIESALKKIIGTHIVPYPAFSSKTVAGKPLFVYALEGALDSIVIPEHKETIHDVSILSLETISNATLKERIEEALTKVPRSDESSKVLGADFRQEVIRPGWRTIMNAIPEREFEVIKLRVVCGSGTYMRTLARRLAGELDTEAFALSINRTKIGSYIQFGPFKFWGRRF